MNPNLPITQGLFEISDMILVGQSTSVKLETSNDFISLLLRQELRSAGRDQCMQQTDMFENLRLRLVVDEPLSKEGDENGEDSFENEDPRPCIYVKGRPLITIKPPTMPVCLQCRPYWRLLPTMGQSEYGS